MTCVIGCGAPGKLCGSNYPSPVSAPGVASLECDTTIPGFDDAPELAQYRDMYDAANDSGIAVPSPIGVTMFSGNQGTPTCWGDIDCAPGETCLIGPAQTGISGLPILCWNLRDIQFGRNPDRIAGYGLQLNK